MTGPLAHHRTRTSPYSHIPYSLAHYDRTTRTYPITRTSPLSHITALAHFDSHITNHSHIPCSLAHYDRTTRTSPLSHIMTEPLAHFDSHISCSLAHCDWTTRTLSPDHSHITNHSHITVAYSNSLISTRTSPHSHIMTGPLAHHCTRTRTFHVHSHISTRT